MTFTAAKIGSWSVGEEYTSAQANHLDSDHVKSLDKTGDTAATGGGISGQIDVLSGGSIVARSGAAMTVQSGGALNVQSGSTLTVAGTGHVISTGAAITCNGTISANGAGKVSADIHDSIISTVDSGISTATQYGLSIQHDQGLVLEGSTSWPSFRSARTFGRNAFAAELLIPSGTSDYTSGSGASTYPVIIVSPSGQIAHFNLTRLLPDNATLQTVTMHFKASTSYASVPTSWPSLNVFYTPQDFSTGVTSLSTGGAVSYPAELLAVWTNNSVKSFTFTCDQNNVITKLNRLYTAAFNDGSGGTGTPGLILLSITVTYSVTALQVA